MLEKFKILGKTLKYHGHIVDFYAYDLQVPNGNKAQWDIIEHKGAAAILPVDSDGKIIMVRQYRGAIDDLLLEIPAGRKRQCGGRVYHLRFQGTGRGDRI